MSSFSTKTGAESNGEPLKKKKRYIMESSVEGDESLEDHLNCSPDMFADCLTESEEKDSKVKDYTTEAKNESQVAHSKSKKKAVSYGASLDEVRNSSAPALPLIAPTTSHTVFYKLPLTPGKAPARYPEHLKDRWDSEHVRMPCSKYSLYPVRENNETSKLRQRWELVQEALLKNVVSSQQLEAVILSYNSKYSERWNFNTLHMLFEEVFEEEETSSFFTSLLPKMIQLALQLPSLITQPIPLLVQHRSHSLSFSQLQIASLLANAFFCTFPRRNTAKRQSEYAQYPDINFNRLYQSFKKDRQHCKIEKLKCLLHYFRRVCTRVPEGIVTYSRQYLKTTSLPHWDRSQKLLPKLHITSEGTIEDEGAGMLQLDFANRLVGGGVLGKGCVQEEIRFVICPELIAARLFTEALDSTEALIIMGCERFNSHKGYSESFVWTGDYKDNTPFDASGRRMCSVVALDALKLGKPCSQFSPSNLMRELNKAYVGFYCPSLQPGERAAGVATGNWGCGAFKGDAKLKALLQLMAAAEAGRHLAYFTFGDTDLCDQVFHMYTFLTEKKVTVSQLWRLLCQYYEKSFRNGRLVADLYPFIYQALSQKDIKPSSSGHQGLATQKNRYAPVVGDKYRMDSLKQGPLVFKERPKKEEQKESSGQNDWLSIKSRGRGLTQKEIEEAFASLPMAEENFEDESDKKEGVEKKGKEEKDVSETRTEDKEVKKKKLNLLDYLDQCDRNSSLNNSSPQVSSSSAPKKKISDYFSSASK